MLIARSQHRMTLLQALKLGYEVRVKLGFVNNQFLENRSTLRVTVLRDGQRGERWITLDDTYLDEVPSMNYIIEKLLTEAMEDMK